MRPGLLFDGLLTAGSLPKVEYFRDNWLRYGSYRPKLNKMVVWHICLRFDVHYITDLNLYERLANQFTISSEFVTSAYFCCIS